MIIQILTLVAYNVGLPYNLPVPPALHGLQCTVGAMQGLYSYTFRPDDDGTLMKLLQLMMKIMTSGAESASSDRRTERDRESY